MDETGTFPRRISPAGGRTKRRRSGRTLSPEGSLNGTTLTRKSRRPGDWNNRARGQKSPQNERRARSPLRRDVSISVASGSIFRPAPARARQSGSLSRNDSPETERRTIPRKLLPGMAPRPAGARDFFRGTERSRDDVLTSETPPAKGCSARFAR